MRTIFLFIFLSPLLAFASLNVSSRVPTTATAPITYSLLSGTIACNVASGSQPGCLSSSDFNTFNGKQAAGNYITALTSDVSASGPGSVAATVNSVGGSTASAVNTATIRANNATSLNTPSTIVLRDASGNFASGAINITSTSANSLVVGPNGATNPVVNVDSSIASAATGINFVPAAAGAGISINAASSGTNEALTLQSKGTGTLNLSSPGAGNISFNTNASPRMTVLSTGLVGIGTTNPTSMLSLNGDAAQVIGLENNSTTAGSTLTVKAGGALVGSTNQSGGGLNIAAGTATGNGGSIITFSAVSSGQGSGTTARASTTKATIQDGNFTVGGNSFVRMIGGTGAVAHNRAINTNGTAIDNTITLLNSGSNSQEYARYSGGIETNTSASESGFFTISTTRVGTLTEAIRIKGNGNLGVGTNNPTSLLSVGANLFLVDTTGTTNQSATYTTTGTTGAQTINKPTGSVNFAALATSLVVTNSIVTANSIITCVVMTNDTTAIIKNVVPTTGSFTITLNAAAAAETKVGFVVHNL